MVPPRPGPPGSPRHPAERPAGAAGPGGRGAGGRTRGPAGPLIPGGGADAGRPWQAGRVSAPSPALVTLHLWRVPRAAVGSALPRLARGRSRARRLPGVRFAKLLGTGDGRTFTTRDADPTRWGLLTTWARAEDAAA